MAGISLRAPAKLNLHLGIHSTLDERRYHRAESLMVALDLADEVTVEDLPGAAGAEAGEAGAGAASAGAWAAGAFPQVTCVPPVDVPAHKNTAYRAAVALANEVGRVPAVSITIHKHVPDQAGMGGSSADAAAVLLALCELWGLDVDDERVVAAARTTGADVPFFLDPVPTLLVGAGDVVAEKFPQAKGAVPVALVRPAGPGVSTPAAYAAFDEQHEEAGDPGELCAALRAGEATAERIAGLLSNNLDPVACRLLPAVAQVRAWLLEQDGVLGGQVTGSGSCVFAICDSEASAERIVADAQEIFGAWAKTAHIA